MSFHKLIGMGRTALRRSKTLAPALNLVRRLREPRLSVVMDHLASALAEDPVLKVSEFQGRFCMSPRSHLFRRIARNGTYEPLLAQRCLAALKPELDVIDVGANIGFYSVLLSRHLASGRLVAVEPTPAAQRRLRRNLELNGVVGKVIVFEGAATDAPGMVTINSVEGAEEYSSIHNVDQSCEVPATTIDLLTRELTLRPGLIKIDVEGFEEQVLKGATDTLRTWRPIIVSELSDFLLRRNGTSALAIVRFLQELGYQVVDPHHPGEAPGYREFGDIVCVPV
jgi:FkbM family methyltransferase